MAPRGEEATQRERPSEKLPRGEGPGLSSEGLLETCSQRGEGGRGAFQVTTECEQDSGFTAGWGVPAPARHLVSPGYRFAARTERLRRPQEATGAPASEDRCAVPGSLVLEAPGKRKSSSPFTVPSCHQQIYIYLFRNLHMEPRPRLISYVPYPHVQNK